VTALIDAYDAALFDLDGVVYLGPVAVPGAAAGIAELRERSVRVGFVTNNANRPPGVVAEHLQALGIPAEPTDVVTSAQAAAHLLWARFGPGAKVYAVGGVGVWSALEEAGLIGVRSADDQPLAVIQGWGEDLTWNDLNEAAIAIQRGAHWVATNTDPTRPTDRGLVPGNGAAVAAVQAAVTVRPEVAGKPYRPLLEETVQRLGARRPIFVGDRLDTDIAGALNCGLDSLLVLTGSHTVADLLAAEPGQRPTQLGFDLRDLLAPVRAARVEDQRAVCGEQAVRVEAGSVRFEGPPPVDRTGALDAAWAAAQLVWAATDAGIETDTDRLLAKLGPLLRPDPVG
jgi:HAD superfamily hydrolase (TIGR01450 family)